MKVNSINKNGSALLITMVIAMLLTVSGLAVLSSSHFAGASVYRYSEEFQEFWNAEGGLNLQKQALDGLQVPLETGGPGGGSGPWTFVDLTAECPYEISVKNVNSGQTASYAYEITSVQIKRDSLGNIIPDIYGNPQTNIAIQTDTMLESMASYATGIYRSGGAWFTKYDKIFGKLYAGEELKLYNSGGLTTFIDDVQVVDAGVFYGSQYSENMAVLLSLICHNGVDKVFQEGLELNADPIDTTTMFNDNAMDRIYEMSGESGGLRLASGINAITIDGNNVIYRDNAGVMQTNFNTKAIYAPNSIRIGGIINGEISVAVRGTTYIHKDGIIYDSAPANLDISQWSESQMDNINDVFCLVSKGRITPYGDNSNDTHINMHGAYMSIDNGLRPDLSYSQYPKRALRVFGCVLVNRLLATESGASGYGCHWMSDPRFASGMKMPEGFPFGFYRFRNWRRIM